MRRHLHLLTTRHEPEGPLVAHLKSGLGAALGLGLVGGLAALTGWPLLIAPLGASVVLLFGQPGSPLAQPANVFGGYFLATVIAVGTAFAAPGLWWATAFAVGVAVAAMLALRVTHPPAGAVPLVVMAAPAKALLLFPMLLVSVATLVGLALLLHRMPPRVAYPKGVEAPGGLGPVARGRVGRAGAEPSAGAP
jgi:CBS-domain-containing membrane protein